MTYRISYRLLAFVVVCAATLGATAQTEALLSHYFDVPAYYNAGAIGTIEQLNIRGAARLQWLGIENAPQTFLGTANMPVKLGRQRVAVGVVAQQEKEGLYSNLTIAAQLGYKLKIKKSELTIGAQVGYLDEGFKGSKVVIPDNDDYHQSTDEAIPTTDVHGGTLDLGVGLWYQHPKFWAGVSCTHVNSPSIRMTGEGQQGNVAGGEDGEGSVIKNFEFEARRTLYLMAGCNIPIKNTLFEVMPSIMVASDLNFYTGQATARLRYNKFLTAGVGYRYNDGVTAMVGAEFKGIYVGYSFDYPLTAIAKASSGSHEIVVGYSMKLDFSEKNKNRHKSIRIM